MSKFEVGQKVKVVENTYHGTVFGKGNVLTVGKVCTYNGCFCYPEGNSSDLEHDYLKGSLFFRDSELELYQPSIAVTVIEYFKNLFRALLSIKK